MPTDHRPVARAAVASKWRSLIDYRWRDGRPYSATADRVQGRRDVAAATQAREVQP